MIEVSHLECKVERFQIASSKPPVKEISSILFTMAVLVETVFGAQRMKKKTSYIEIDLPKEYKITVVSIEVQDRIKIGIALFALFYNKRLQLHVERVCDSHAIAD